MLSARSYILIGLFILLIFTGCTPRGASLSKTVVATAYNSHPFQTDASPWVTASGYRCGDGVVACNFLPFGTRLKIEGFGEKVFVVRDRMHRRFSQRLDIWMPSYKQALLFGKRKLRYTVLGS